MDRKAIRGLRPLLTLVGLALPLQAQDHDWPQWRGTAQDGVSGETAWKSMGRDKPLWETEVGMGYSAISVVDGKLYTCGFDEEAGIDIIWCLDALSGKPLWEYTYAAKATPSLDRGEGHHGGTNSTPTINGDKVYVMNREGWILCLDADTGDLHWKHNYVKDEELVIPTWGFAASPYLQDSMLVINMGKVLGLEPNTGEILWASKDYGHAYSTPTGFRRAGQDRLAIFNSKGLAIIDPFDGTEIAFREWITRYNINAASPIIAGDRIHISSGQGKGQAFMRLTDEGLELLWENKHMASKMSGCVLLDGHLYGFSETILRCENLEGKTLWSQRGLGYGSLMAAGKRLLVLDEDGNLLVVQADPTEFRLLASSKVLEGGVYWTSPTLSNGLIYCRNSLGHLVCLDHRVD